MDPSKGTREKPGPATTPPSAKRLKERVSFFEKILSSGSNSPSGDEGVTTTTRFETTTGPYVEERRTRVESVTSPGSPTRHVTTRYETSGGPSRISMQDVPDASDVQRFETIVGPSTRVTTTTYRTVTGSGFDIPQDGQNVKYETVTDPEVITRYEGLPSDSNITYQTVEGPVTNVTARYITVKKTIPVTTHTFTTKREIVTGKPELHSTTPTKVERYTESHVVPKGTVIYESRSPSGASRPSSLKPDIKSGTVTRTTIYKDDVPLVHTPQRPTSLDTKTGIPPKHQTPTVTTRYIKRYDTPTGRYTTSPSGDEIGTTSYETAERVVEEGDLASGNRMVTTEKITVRRNVQDILLGAKSPSGEDSAYQTLRVTKSLGGSSTSSNVTGRFPSEENLTRSGSPVRSESPDQDWYHDYRNASFQSTRLDAFRSRSEYDNHIAQIRGMFVIFTYKLF